MPLRPHTLTPARPFTSGPKILTGASASKQTSAETAHADPGPAVYVRAEDPEQSVGVGTDCH